MAEPRLHGLHRLAVPDQKARVEVPKVVAGRLRRELGARLDLRYAPMLELRLDHSMEHADQVNRLLRRLLPGEK